MSIIWFIRSPEGEIGGEWRANTAEIVKMNVVETL